MLKTMNTIKRIEQLARLDSSRNVYVEIIDLIENKQLSSKYIIQHCNSRIKIINEQLSLLCKKRIKFMDLETEIDGEILLQDIIDVDFDGQLMVRFIKRDNKWIAQNAVNGYGSNVKNEVYNKEAEII